MRAIDADAMIDRLKEWDTKDKTDKALYNFTLNRINEQPTIQPRRGQWIMSNVGDTFMTDAPKIIYCSSCNVCAPYATNYCPMCGADMRGEQDG